MQYILITPIGEQAHKIFAGLQQFTTKKAILISTTHTYAKAREIAKQLEEHHIEYTIIEMKKNPLEEMFRIFGELASQHNPDELIVNLSTGGEQLSCAALSASYAHGLKAFEIIGEQATLMPIMKLSYYDELSPNKRKILKALSQKESKNLTTLGKELGMSVALLSYHINGTHKHKGLKTLRVINTKEEGKQVKITLSRTGWLLMQGQQ